MPRRRSWAAGASSEIGSRPRGEAPSTMNRSRQSRAIGRATLVSNAAARRNVSGAARGSDAAAEPDAPHAHSAADLERVGLDRGVDPEDVAPAGPAPAPAAAIAPALAVQAAAARAAEAMYGEELVTVSVMW